MKFIQKSLSLLLFFATLLMLFGCTEERISLNDIPAYSGDAYVVINGGEPFFTEDEITASAYESYAPLDALGRCGAATASLGKELMPTGKRGDISSVYPSGWKYNGVSNNREYDFGYIYNRCHLIGWQLSGEDANEKNLITGTVYMNIEGMLPFENMVADYIKETENHVMYRVTPIYGGYNLLADGVLIEALSVEDGGSGIKFCVYAYNVQPDIEIDYFTGINNPIGEKAPENPDDTVPPESSVTYILNKNSKKFHIPGEGCANSISEANREEYNGTREDLVENGYDPCGTCKP